LIQQAQEYGLPAIVIRPGTISGSTESGAVNLTDFLTKFMIGMIQLKAYPNVSTSFDMVIMSCKLS
jgi:thioester reductase-like protein